MQRFDELNTRNQVVKDPCQMLAWIKAGLRADIRRELIRQPIYGVEHAFLVALDKEYLRFLLLEKS